MPDYSTIERAFQIVRSGECKSLADMRAILSHEPYSSAAQLTSFVSVGRRLNG